MATFDTSQLEQLAADLGNAPKNAGPNIYKAFTVTSARIKKEWQQKLSGTPQVPFGPLTITYDVSTGITGPLGSILSAFGVEHLAGANTISSEIGAQDGRKQAPIVTVLEFGSPVNNLPPHGYGAEALADNASDFVNGLLIAIGDPLGMTSEQKDAFYLGTGTATGDTQGQLERSGGSI